MSTAAAALGVCLALAASLPPGSDHIPRDGSERRDQVRLQQSHFTLAWTHSIEKTRWEEDYRVVASPDGRPALQLTEARIRGSGAGMDPPEGAVLRAGWYVYRPSVQPGPVLRLTRSRYTADYDWCVEGRCQPLSAWLPSDGGVTLVWACGS